MNKTINTAISDDFDYNNLSNITSTFYKISDEDNILKYKGSSLSCNYDTKLNLYFDIKSQDFLYDNFKNNFYQTMYYLTSTDISGLYTYSKYTVNVKDDKLCFSINDIAPQNLDRIFLLNVWNYGADKEIMYPYSPMTYIFKTINSDDKKLANLSKSMYWYWNAANEYLK